MSAVDTGLRRYDEDESDDSDRTNFRTARAKPGEDELECSNLNGIPQ
jgi:hypothetical protein